MPILREYRVVMPLTVEEYQLGRQWHRVERLKLDADMLMEAKKNEYPEEVIESRPVTMIPFMGRIVDGVQGEYDKKYYGNPPSYSNAFSTAFYCFGSFLEVMFSSAIKITEIETWEAYPYYRSVSKNLHLNNNYIMTIEAIYLPGSTRRDNALGLPESLLKLREVVNVDIAANVAAADYRDGRDPAIFVSKDGSRGPLKSGWMETAEPCMTCYILIDIKFDLPGFNRMVENRLHNGILHSLTLHHRELFCFIDTWKNVQLEDACQEEKKLLLKISARTLELAAIQKDNEDRPSCCFGGSSSIKEGETGENKTAKEGETGGGCPLQMFQGAFQNKFLAIPTGIILLCLILALVISVNPGWLNGRV